MLPEHVDDETWQAPFWQVEPEQHSAVAVHAPPTGWQVGAAPHTPPLQVPPQQSPSALQAPPCSAQAEPHLPWLQLWEQHSLARVQVSPACPQAPQTPLLQIFEQQSSDAVQLAPEAAQEVAHTPSWQVSPLQQPPSHDSPSCPHAVHTSLAQVPLQHSENAAQALPPALHESPPPVPEAALWLELVAEWPPPPKRLESALPQAASRAREGSKARGIHERAVIEEASMSKVKRR